MRHWVITSLAFVSMCLVPAMPAHAAKRVALVVGIDIYDNLPAERQLRRAVGDARAVSATFKDLGYEVILGENLTRGAFNRLWQQLLERVDRDDTVAVYFSGHGVEIEGLNFLIPRDIPAVSYGRQEQIKRESLSVSEFLLDLRKRKPQVSLVILDACRDHPLAPQEGKAIDVKGGLAKMDAPEGSFIMYAAGAGETALDRLPSGDRDPNSVYTRHLLPLLKTPGLELPELARLLRTQVRALAATVHHPQTPAYYDGVLGRFCLAGCEVPVAVANNSQAPLTEGNPANAPDRAATSDVGNAQRTPSEVSEAWAQIQNSDDLGILDGFRRQFGSTNPFYGSLATSRIEKVKRAQAKLAEADRKKVAGTQTEITSKAKEAAKPIPQVPIEPANLDGIEARHKAEERANSTRVTEGQRLAMLADKKKSQSTTVAMVAGSVFRDCLKCPEMVVVPSGEFTMGSPDNEARRLADEGPQHRVTVKKPFAVSKFEITFDEWDACVSDGVCKHKPDDAGWGRGRRPVINVSFSDIQTQYLPWLSRVSLKSYRLLTESEWEYSARAGTTTRTYFGDSVTTQQAQISGGMWSGGAKRTSDVGHFPSNRFGLYDTHGNVMEWVQDCYINNYKNAPLDGSAVSEGDCSTGILRGGSWAFDPEYVRSAERKTAKRNIRSIYIGFRVAMN